VRTALVDDEPRILRALRINLTTRGYEVTTAATGAGALRAVAERAPGVIVLEMLVRNRGKLAGQKELLQEVWGPAYATETHYLRVYVAQMRRKLEPQPGRPRHLLTEAGMGYRFMT